MKRITMRQIARDAGVSLTTVSDVLNDRPGAYVAKATRRKVLAAAERGGYQHGALAAAIRRPLRHLGLATADLAGRRDGLTAMVAEGVVESAAHRGYLPLLHSEPTWIARDDRHLPRPSDKQAPARMIELVRTRLAAGFVVDKQYFLSAAVEHLAAEGVPMVLVNGARVVSPRTKRAIPSVAADFREAGRLATQHLIALGHRRIGLICRPFRRLDRPYRTFQVQQLMGGHAAALKQAGIAPDRALVTDASAFDRASVAAAVKRLLSRPTPPTALVCGDDAIAVMVLQELHRLGLATPDDVSVVGCGNQPEVTRFAQPALTTLDLFLRGVGGLAADMLIDLLEGEPPADPQIVLAPWIVEGASTGPAARTPATVRRRRSHPPAGHPTKEHDSNG